MSPAGSPPCYLFQGDPPPLNLSSNFCNTNRDGPDWTYWCDRIKPGTAPPLDTSPTGTPPLTHLKVPSCRAARASGEISQKALPAVRRQAGRKACEPQVRAGGPAPPRPRPYRPPACLRSPETGKRTTWSWPRPGLHSISETGRLTETGWLPRPKQNTRETVQASLKAT